MHRLPELAISPIPHSQFILLYLYKKSVTFTDKQIANYLKKHLTLEQVHAGIKALRQQGYLEVEGNKIKLNTQGEQVAQSELGKDRDVTWDKLCTGRLLFQALAYDPDDANVKKRFQKAEGFRYAILGRAFSLERPETIGADGIRSEIVWRQLKPVIADFVTPPYPLLGPRSVIGHTILAGMAGATANGMKQAVEQLSSRLLGLTSNKIEDLRTTLLQRALNANEPATTEKTQTAQAHSPEKINDSPTTEAFAQRVLTVAKDLETPPFRGQVAIDQVYDAYGRVYADAGSLDDFKRRVLQAAMEEKLDLTRANLLAQLPDPDRSEIRWGRDTVHLVVVEWK